MQISVEDAAARLGVSARTVRHRLQSGALRGERVSAKSGTAWAVEWDDDAGAEVTLRALVGEAVSETFGEVVAPLVERTEDLARENERLRAQVAALELVAVKVAARGWWRK